MALPAGGWTTDQFYADVLDATGALLPVFRGIVASAIKYNLTNKEVTGVLTAAEKALYTDLYHRPDQLIDRAISFIKTDAGALWPAKGMYMTGLDVYNAIVAQWANILKAYE